ncbi:carotenoid oxygenase [Gilbertella persicaria]|uniref:carotenoid oxygenase n=1 Tax=Gilbertella persicaria TaxID=101096 RepID=UPI00221FCD7B|nr:carotenoid oxygenase [Gilbertella persicaria]KAI8075388.1 carotenoid oxygenase [Gilbertella persicaria]
MADKALLDIAEEEQASLVQNTSSSNLKQLEDVLMDDSHALPNIDATTIDNEIEDSKKEHPLATISLEEDPWAGEDNTNDLLELNQKDELAVTSNVVNEDSQAEETVQGDEVILDKDTSAIKGFQNFQDSDKIDDLKVSGRLPEWLTGEYFTVGPATYDIKYSRKVEVDGELINATAIYTFGHWFDALPLVSRFDLNGSRNTVTYRNKSTSRRLVEKIREHHGFAPQHPAGLFMSNTNQTVLSKFLGSSKVIKPDAEPCGARVLASIPGLEGRLFAQNFAHHIQELDPFDLKPIRLFTWSEINPKFKGTSSCPNGQYDSRTGEYINFTLEIGYQSVKYNFFSISDRNPKGSVIASITAPMAYVNTFSITPRYILFVIHPMLANSGGVKFNWNESIMDSFSFNSSEPTLFYVISRQKGEVVATYRSNPCFIFNHINAFEDDRGNVFLDMICYPDDTIARQLATEFLRNPDKMEPSRLVASEVRRYKLTNIEEESINYMANNGLIPSKNSVSTRISSVFGMFGNNKRSSLPQSEAYSENAKKWYSWMPIASFDKRVQPSIELPQINPKFKMQKYSFMYGLGFSASNALKDGAIWDSIVKTNMETKQIVASWQQDNCYPSEAIFIPRPDEQVEDVGALLSVVLDSARKRSFLLVLDASSFQVLATVDLERIMPISFAHGSYRLREDN